MRAPSHSGRPAVPTPQDAKGHRARLWQKFQSKGLRDAFHHGYEKLEFILTFTIPRADTKPIARALLKQFGSLNGIFSAAPHELEKVTGVGPKTAHYLSMFRELTLAMDEEKLARRSLLKHPDLVKSYLEHELAWVPCEYLLVLFLDGRCRLIHKERLLRGTVDRVPHYPRELAKEALTHNAVGVILAHNHPSGDCTPSQSDIKHTREIHKALALLDIQLHDHLVVGREGITSMKEARLLQV